MKRVILIITLLVFTATVFSQEKSKQNRKKPSFEPPETVTKTDRVTIDGETISYSVEAGYITLQTEYGKEQAHIFYIAYTKNGVDDITERPVTFSFNGGPGSSSVWLHLGMLGPRRVKMTGKGDPPAPPYELVNNEYSWLDQTDMVFIDPVSTGFSRAHKKKKAKQYHGFKKDIQSVGQFIRRYLNDEHRWGSPKYIIGESYGTTRAAGLSNHLINHYGVYLNGVILVSYVNNFQTLSFRPGNDLPYSLFLPSYTAAAWYHNQLSKELLEQPLPKVLEAAEQFSTETYSVALHKGNRLSQQEADRVTKGLHRYTGLPERYIRHSNYRISSNLFRKEILSDSLQVIGRFDARYKAADVKPLANRTGTDPSYNPTVHGPYSTLINDYLTREIGFDTKVVYEVLSHRVWPWDFKPYSNRYLNVATDLQDAVMKNPDMDVWIVNGYYDLATPYFATKYTIDHMRLPDKLQDNIELSYHRAGHMMYIHPPSLKEVKQKAKKFYNK